MSSPPAVRYSRGELDLDAVSLIVHLDSFGLDREAGGGGGGERIGTATTTSSQ